VANNLKSKSNFQQRGANMYRVKVIAILLIAGVTLSSCASDQGLYEWGAYESKLYVYTKKPDKREEYRQALTEAIMVGKAKNRVAPSLYAELGYLALEDGDLDAAAGYFKAEQELFPESAYFLNTVMSRARGEAPDSDNEEASDVVIPSADEVAS
jgi:hypothetical protein